MRKYLSNKTGEGHIDTALKIIIGVVIGAVILGGLYLLFAGDDGVGILGLLSIGTIGVTSMLIGAVMVFVPQFLIALLPPHKALGGADIKLSTALVFLLGWQKGLAALVLGLFLAVIVMMIVQKVDKKKRKVPFALIPFLSTAAMIVFVI